MWGQTVAAKVFSKVSAPVHIHSSNLWGSLLLITLTHLLYTNISCYCYYRHPSVCEVPLWFRFAFDWCLMILRASGAYLPFEYLLWRNIYSNPLSIFNYYYFFFYCCASSLYIPNIGSLLYALFTNILSILWVDFSLFVSVLRSKKLF